MEMAILLIEQIIELFIMLLCGLFLVKTNLLKERDSQTLSTLLLYIAAPCAIINAFAVEMNQETLIGLGISFLGAILVHIILIPTSHIISKFFHFNEIEEATLVYSNSGNLIIPLVTSILGSEWVLYTSGYMMVQTFLIWTHGKSLICNKKEMSFKNIFMNVGVVSILIGLVIFIFQIPLPNLVSETVSKISAMMGPLAMIIIGMLIGKTDIKKVFVNKRMYLVSFFRLIVLPLICIIVIKILNLEALSSNAYQILMITTLATCAPAAAMVTQFAQLYHRDQRYASLLNIMTVLFSIITMPLMIMIYQLL
ncbi:MAG: AEC family transporter [Erysipelotrichaceae bacterium]|nr:AEC family transporter [Erysipelotrichaceae bacterium]